MFRSTSHVAGIAAGDNTLLHVHSRGDGETSVDGPIVASRKAMRLGSATGMNTGDGRRRPLFALSTESAVPRKNHSVPRRAAVPDRRPGPFHPARTGRPGPAVSLGQIHPTGPGPVDWARSGRLGPVRSTGPGPVEPARHSRLRATLDRRLRGGFPPARRAGVSPARSRRWSVRRGPRGSRGDRYRT
jgi:hypothetical protein